MTTTRYSANKWPARDTEKSVQRDRKSESQRAREPEVSKQREAEVTSLKTKLQKRSGGKERRMVHLSAVTVTKGTQIEASLGLMEDTRMERAERATPQVPGCSGPVLLSSCSPEVLSGSNARGMVTPAERSSSPGLFPAPIPRPRKTLARKPVARSLSQNQHMTAVDALAMIKFLHALAAVLSSMPAAGGLPPPLEPIVPIPTLAVDPFLKWSDPDPGKFRDDLLIML